MANPSSRYAVDLSLSQMKSSWVSQVGRFDRPHVDVGRCGREDRKGKLNPSKGTAFRSGQWRKCPLPNCRLIIERELGFRRGPCATYGPCDENNTSPEHVPRKFTPLSDQL
ncbi:hypothetical protein CDAR_73051 [Caerostris darwini]|uniref:Uncharacterized protein n=1 Tax=Caerostris darwini TaxID=1538125 RepID=A0AAV4VNB3_9ARAC|nr:hypothetical protein CDAR_73051 [Caerostris darwini]